MNRRRNTLLIVLLLALVAVFAPSAVSLAQNDNLCEGRNSLPFIEYGDTVDGSIDDDAYIFGYCFEGSEGDEIRINMTAPDGDLDPLVALGDPTLEEVYAQNDDVSSRNTDAEIEFVLPDDGVYLILASRSGLEDGRSEGDYELTLELLNDEPPPPPAGAACEEAAEDFPVIEYGDTVEGEITDDSVAFIFCFDGLEDDEIVISMTATSGDLDTLLFLTDPTLEETFADNDDIARGNTDSEIEFTLPADGAYLIVATRFNVSDGSSEGDFELSLEVVGGPSVDGGADGGKEDDGGADSGSGDVDASLCADVALEFDPPVVAYGDTIENEISDEFPAFVLCFVGNEGDVVSITIEATRGDLEPVVLVLDGQFEETIASTEDEIEFELPADGAYVILVSRVDFTDGDTEGEFELTLELVEGGSGGGASGSSSGDAVCEVTAVNNVNRRTGPGTNFDRAGTLDAGETATAVAQAEGSDGQIWWELEDGSFVREDTVEEAGDCDSLPPSR